LKYHIRIYRYLNDIDYATAAMMYIQTRDNSQMNDRENAIAITRTKAAAKRLSGLRLIKQDGRSVRTGHRVDSTEALFYTCPEMRELIDLIKYGVI
jgi:hypothetical protein